MTAPLTNEVLDELRKYDSPTICNVIELLDYRPRNLGFAHAQVRAVFPTLPPTVGYAVTATFRSATEADRGETATSLADQLEAFATVPEPRIVVIQDLDDPPCGAVFGEVMVSSYKGFGCIGLVTNGYARDIAQIKPLDFQCFAAGLSVSHAYCRVLDVQVPVQIGGATIRPGDLLHGDENGVTTIPLEIAADVAGACKAFVDAEAVVINAARQANPTLDAYRIAMAEFGKRRAVIAARLRKSAARSGGEDLA